MTIFQDEHDEAPEDCPCGKKLCNSCGEHAYDGQSITFGYCPQCYAHLYKPETERCRFCDGAIVDALCGCNGNVSCIT